MAAKRAESTGDPRESHTLPGVHVAHLAELVQRWETTPEELLAPFGLTVETLAEPTSRVSVPLIERIVARARTLTGEPGLGFYLGLQMRISAHGFLGFAAMVASTVREAIVLVSRFAPTRTTAIGIRLEERDDRAFIILDEHCSFGTARDFILVALTVGFGRMGNALTSRELLGELEVEYAFPEPEYHARFVQLSAHEFQLSPNDVRFSQPANRVVLDRKALDLPIAMADPDALRLARDQCERELDRLGYRRSLVTRVRALLSARDRELPPVERVARELGTSVRTLKRKLAEEGTTYSGLVDEVQVGRAALLLRSGLTVDEIADRLGYSDAANFTRAFRRWTGKSPRAYRKG
jgi:AraC-like DNA-binding protein